MVRFPFLILYIYITWMLQQAYMKRKGKWEVKKKNSRTRERKSNLPGTEDISDTDSLSSSIIRISESSTFSLSTLHVVLKAVCFFLDVLKYRPLEESSFISVELFLLSSSFGFPFIFFELSEYSFGFFLFDLWFFSPRKPTICLFVGRGMDER